MRAPSRRTTGSPALLVTLGLHGLISFSVRRRTQQIGIRSAQVAEGRPT